MNIESARRSTIAFLTDLSTRFGSGDVTVDVLLCSILGSLFALGLGIYAYRKSVSGNVNFDKAVGVSGELSRLDAVLSEFRTETKRSLDELRGDMRFVKQDVRDVRAILGGGGGPGGETGGPGQGLGRAEQSSVGTAQAAPEVSDTADRAPGVASRLRRFALVDRIRGIFTRKPLLDQEMVDELEALLISSDMGVSTVRTVTDQLREELARRGSVTEEDVYSVLRNNLIEILQAGAPADPEIIPGRQSDGPLVVMVVGVNGVGKTTTVAKLASLWSGRGAKVMMAAGDTFRAAAVEQLNHWGRLIGVPVISGSANAKPATVVFDAVDRAAKETVDVLIIDTAGRLHTKSNLMQELHGVRNIISRQQPAAPHETLLVVDGSTGQNALLQARDFHAAVPLTGLVITKLDGTPKGGIVVAIKNELNIPVRYIGIGEGKADLRPFDSAEFVDALLGRTTAEPSGKTSVHAQERSRKRRAEEMSV